MYIISLSYTILYIHTFYREYDHNDHKKHVLYIYIIWLWTISRNGQTTSRNDSPFRNANGNFLPFPFPFHVLDASNLFSRNGLALCASLRICNAILHVLDAKQTAPLGAHTWPGRNVAAVRARSARFGVPSFRPFREMVLPFRGMVT